MLDKHWEKEEYAISTDKTKLDVFAIYDFLRQSYWAKNRSFTEVVQSFHHSLCFGLYHHEKTIGFARLITDFSTFAYLADVFVIEAYRGKGLGRWLVETILHAEELKIIKTWLLTTKDAQTLYQKFGFNSPLEMERIMVKKIEEHA